MTFDDLTTRFQSILNRDDCTAGAALIYLQDAMARIARESRLPNMERSVILTVADQPLTFMAIPLDLIETIDIFVTNDPTGLADVALELVTGRQLLAIAAANVPQAYSRFEGQFNFRGLIPPGASVVFNYYGEFSDIADGSSENEITASNPDLVVYAALSFAGDVFDHPSTERWEARYAQILSQVQGLGIDADSKGGPTAIAPMYWS